MTCGLSTPMKNITKRKNNINKIILILGLFFLLIFGIINIFKFPIWSPIDEPSHFNYIEHLATKHKLPILNLDPISWQTVSISMGIYPNHPGFNPSENIQSFGNTIYEGFQPPVSYLISAPFYYLAGSNYYHKIFLLRFICFLQYLIAVFFIYKIFKKYDLPQILFLGTILIPGVILRTTSVSNAATEILLITLIIYFLLCRLKQEINIKQFLSLGILIGMAILTRFTSVFILPAVIIYLIYYYRKWSWNLLFIIIVPLVLAAPWFAWNYQHFGTLTSNKIAQEMQLPVIAPNGKLNNKLLALKNLDNTFNHAFFTAEEQGYIVNKNIFFRFSNQTMVVLFSLVSIYSLIYTIIGVYNLLKNKFGRENNLLFLSSIVFAGNLLLLWAIDYSWTFSPARYLYSSVAAILICLYLFLKKCDNLSKYFLYWFVIFIVSLNIYFALDLFDISNYLR